MSVKAWEKYQPNASSPSPQYPYGSLRQETALGMGNGTPLDVEWGNDFEAFKQTAFSRSGLVPSGNTDTVTNSEMFNAMQDTTTRALWERSAAESGYNLVAGSFEEGGALVNANDVLWSKKLNKIFSGPVGSVTAGTNPASNGFVDVSAVLSGAKLSSFVYSSRFSSIDELNQFILTEAAVGCCVVFDTLLTGPTGVVTNKPITLKCLGQQVEGYFGDELITTGVRVTTTGAIGVEIIPNDTHFPTFSDGRVIVTGVDIDQLILRGPSGSTTDLSKRAAVAVKVRESSAVLGEYHVRGFKIDSPNITGFIDGIDISAGTGRNQDSYLHTYIKPRISACGRGIVNKGSQNTVIEPNIVNCSVAGIDMNYKNSGLRVFGGTVSESYVSIKRDITSWLEIFGTQCESWDRAGVLITHEDPADPFPYGVNVGRIDGKFIKASGSEPAIELEYLGPYSDTYIPIEIEGSYKCTVAVKSDQKIKRGLVLGKNITGNVGNQGLSDSQLVNFVGEKLSLLRVFTSGVLSAVNSPIQRTITINSGPQQTVDIIKVPNGQAFNLWWLSRYSYNSDRSDTGNAFIGVFNGATQLYSGFGNGTNRPADGAAVFNYQNNTGATVTLLIKVNDASSGFGGRADYAFSVT